MTLLAVFIAITGLFGIWLGLRRFLRLNICVICVAVSSVWLGLLIAYRLGWFHNPLLLALLMGMSVTGLYFFIEKRVPTPWLLFRLPALLTIAYLFYATLSWQAHLPAGLFLLGLWALFGTVYMLRAKPMVKRSVQKMIECCGNW